MKMIIGGAYQGKLAYAKTHYERELSHGIADGNQCSPSNLAGCGCVYGLHHLIEREMEKQREKEEMTILSWEDWAFEFAEKIKKTNPQLLIITDELGYGIVPLEKKDRELREVTGRVCTSLAACAEEIIRVVCGIGTIIKQDQNEK